MVKKLNFAQASKWFGFVGWETSRDRYPIKKNKYKINFLFVIVVECNSDCYITINYDPGHFQIEQNIHLCGRANFVHSSQFDRVTIGSCTAAKCNLMAAVRKLIGSIMSRWHLYKDQLVVVLADDIRTCISQLVVVWADGILTWAHW